MNSAENSQVVNNANAVVVAAWRNPKYYNNDEIPGETVLDRILNTPGSLLKEDDIKGMLENGVYTHDLIIKARRLGIKPNELLQAQAKALHSIGKLNGYSQLGEDFPDNETAIWEAVSNANKKDLLYL